MLTSTAIVPTDAAARYAKHLLSHLGRKAGVEGMLFHDLRRTAVRNLLRAGVSQRTAMEISGHQTDSVFRRYDIVDTEDMRVAQERMQAYLDARSAARKGAR